MHKVGVCPRSAMSAVVLLCLVSLGVAQTKVVYEPPVTVTNVLTGDIYLVAGESRAQDGVVALAPVGGTNSYSGRTEDTPRDAAGAGGRRFAGRQPAGLQFEQPHPTRRV